MNGLFALRMKLAALMASVVWISACGGGGSATGNQPAPIGPPVEPAAVTSVPPAQYSDARRTAAFEHLNKVRAAAGLGLLTQNAALDQAAQSHSVYQLANSEFGHDETLGKPHYTGAGPTGRIMRAGYLDIGLSTEVTASLPSTATGGNPLQIAIYLVDILMGAPYHRGGILFAEFADVGIGLADKDGVTVMTINLARSKTNAQGAPNTLISLWPPADATDLPTAMLTEVPDPIPENLGSPAGYAASVKVNGQFWGINVETFTLRDPSGNLVDAKLLSQATDPILSGILSDPTFAAILPRKPLLKNTRYNVTFVGTVISGEERIPKPVTRSWSFTTGDRFAY